MIQRMLPIWSLVPLPFLKPAWTSGSSWSTYCWSLGWRILSITLVTCEIECNCVLVWTFFGIAFLWVSLMAQMVKLLPAMQETWVPSLGQEDPLEKEMATYSSTLAWKIPWTEKPGRLQSMESQRVGHDWMTSLSLGLEWKVTFSSPVVTAEFSKFAGMFREALSQHHLLEF